MWQPTVSYVIKISFHDNDFAFSIIGKGDFYYGIYCLLMLWVLPFCAKIFVFSSYDYCVLLLRLGFNAIFITILLFVCWCIRALRAALMYVEELTALKKVAAFLSAT